MSEVKVGNKSQKENLLYIDIIKILSAVAIVIFHFDVHTFYINNEAPLLGKLTYFNVSLGDLAISMFIIMSGLTLSLSAKPDFSIINFYKKRMLAIMPSFWLSYVFVAIIFIFFGKTIGDGKYWKLILTFLGLDGFFLYKMPTYYLVGEWYTGYMLITYIFFPFIYKRMKKTPVQMFIILFLFSIILHLRYEFLFRIPETCNPLMRLLDFSFGILITICIFKNRKIKIVSFLLSVLYMIFYQKMFSILPYHYHMIFVGFSLFLILEFIISFMGDRFENSIIARILNYLSRLTFLSFLIHHQIINFCYKKLNNLAYFSPIKKCVILSIIIVVSFSYAALLQPLVKKITKKLYKNWKIA